MLLITGATGTIGGAVAAHLLGRGAALRVFVRNPAKAEALQAMGAEVIVGDLADGHALSRAFRGVTRALLFPCLDPPGLALCRTLRDVLRESPPSEGVIALSSLGASTTAATPILRWHGEADAIIAEGAAAPVLFVRPAYMMTNFLAVSQRIREQGELPNPFGETVIPLTALEDVVRVIERAFLAKAFAGGALDCITSWRSLPQVARAEQEVAGHPLRAVAARWEELHPGFAHPETPRDIRAAGEHLCQCIRGGHWGRRSASTEDDGGTIRLPSNDPS